MATTPTSPPDDAGLIARQDAGTPRGQPVGHGRALLAAFDALEGFPALAESRDRVLRLTESGLAPSASLAVAVESDPALAIAVLRMANQASVRPIESIPGALEALATTAVHEIVGQLDAVDVLDRSGAWDLAPERFRLHAVAAQRVCELLIPYAGYGDRDRLAVVCLLHDVGKLVLMRAYTGYPGSVHGDARSPDERVQRERRELGVDHAMVGGVIVRRWELPATIASAVERHHSAQEPGEAALVALADLIVHYAGGERVAPAELVAAARRADVRESDLRDVMYELPFAAREPERRIDPCPLTEREVAVLQLLAEGKVYKQIARELSLSVSTIRTHLHNTYGKLGAVDRAQAVLIATQRGWL